MISCGDATGVDSSVLTGVAHSGSSCTFTVDPIDTLASGSQGDTSFTIPLTSTGGHTLDASITVNIGPDSTITYTAPTGAGSLNVAKNRALTVDVSGYAAEIAGSGYVISCGDVTSFDTTELSSVTHTGSSCEFTITPKNVAGAATFTVPYISTGGHSIDSVVPITVGPDSVITVTPPSSNITVVVSLAVTVDFSDYADETLGSGYVISCGTPTTASSLISIGTPNGCSVEITAGAATGTASVSVAYTSDGGATATGSFTIDVIPDSDISFTAPSGLLVATNRTRVIDVLDHASDGGYTITCGDATSIDSTELQSVVRDSSGDGCSFTITPKNVQGTASFTVPLTSAGGDTEDAVFSIEVGPASTFAFSAPSGLKVGRNRTLTIDALDSITEDAAYVVSCGDAAGVDASKFAVTRTTSGDGCTFTVDPVDTLTPSNQGDVTFTVTFTSNGGTDSASSIDGTFTVNIGPDSTISYTAPDGLKIGRNRTLEIDVSAHAREASASSYDISCGDATGVDNTKLTGVTRSSCTFTVDPVDTCLLYTSPSPRD